MFMQLVFFFLFMPFGEQFSIPSFLPFLEILHSLYFLFFFSNIDERKEGGKDKTANCLN